VLHRACARAHRRMRAKLRSPVFEVLKQQRAMRQFRTRQLDRVGNEFTLATMAFNITRLYGLRTA
jgi:hypothetical protein